MKEKIPFRKRGYYRAVKSGKEWALRIHRLGEGTFKWLIAFHWRCVDFEKLTYANNPLLERLPKQSGFQGASYTIPIGESDE